MERFGELLLMERLASGGMAEVFRAKHLGYAGFEKTVAVKRILPHFATSDDFKSMFRAEANLSAMLQHANITQVFSNGEIQGYLFLVMEYVDGKNLRQILARADKVKVRIPIEISCFIVSEALKGLDYAHNYHDERTGEALSIVHRDVSPQNVMLGYEGSVKLVDFGIAKAASKNESTRAGVLKGKFGYMSPEQASGATLDKRSDIFSMGIILWELLTQRRLFTYEDELKTLEKVRECKVPRPSEKNPTIPYALEKIVMRALEKDSGQRYSSGAEFYGDLVRYMNDRHPNFISTDFSKFMKEFYREEIAEEKKRRERLNLEAPAFMASNPSTKSRSNHQRKEQTHTRTDAEHNDENTMTSGIFVAPPEPSAPAAAPVNPEEIRSIPSPEPTRLDPPQNQMPYGLQSSPQSKIQIPSTSTNSQFQIQPAPNKFKLLRAVAIVAVLAMGTFAALNYLPAILGSQVTVLVKSIKDSVKPQKPVEESEAPFQENKDELIAQDSVENPDQVANTPEVIEEPAEEVDRGLAAVGVFMWEPKKYTTYGSITINGVPDADEILINGKKLVVGADLSGIKTPVRDLKLPPGTYEMVLKNRVFGVSKSVSVKIEENKSEKIDVILDKR